MKRIPRYVLYFAIPYLIFFIVMLTLILLYDKKDLHLLLNSYHPPFLGNFFRYLTWIGSFGPLVIGAIYAFHRFGQSIYILTVQLLNLLFTNTLKIIFAEPRPKTFFAENYPDITLDYVKGITIHTSNGFPSGHTSAAFALMLCIAILSKNKFVSFICSILAILVGYSRIYLSQHFAEDVLFGSAIGVFTTMLLFYYYRLWINKLSWADKSFIYVFRREKKVD